jgi:uncharacterized protein (TIGR02147 family)
MTIEMSGLSPNDLIREEYGQRRKRNSSYSLRAFARDLEVSVGALSEILANKRKLTPKSTRKILPHLNLSPIKKDAFLKNVLHSYGGDSMTPANVANEVLLAEDHFQFISEWYHFAILSLLKLDEYIEDPAWIAARIGIQTFEAKNALSRLQRLGLIIKKNGRSVRQIPAYTTTNDVPSAALKESHRQTLEQSIESLFRDAVDIREITSTTMAIDRSRIREGKELIMEFRKRFQALMEDGQKNEVYNLNIQFVPVTKFKSEDIN